MANKTIPELPAITTIPDYAIFPVDNTAETFKITAANLALYVAGTIMPAGMLMPFAGATAPSGWLFADGSAVSRSTYARLFTAIGTAYGTGNGTTTFNVPDLRGRVPAGKDNMGGSAASRLTTAGSGIDGTTLGASGGAQGYTPTGTLSGLQSIAHVHTLNNHSHNMSHVHQWGMFGGALAGSGLYVNATSDKSKTSITASDTRWVALATASNSGVTTHYGNQIAGGVNLDFFTTGVIDPPYGSSGTFSNTGPANDDSGAMSANNTVLGSNFTFTGNATTNAQPTLVTNYIIRV